MTSVPVGFDSWECVEVFAQDHAPAWVAAGVRVEPVSVSPSQVTVTIPVVPAYDPPSEEVVGLGIRPACLEAHTRSVPFWLRLTIPPVATAGVSIRVERGIVGAAVILASAASGGLVPPLAFAVSRASAAFDIGLCREERHSEVTWYEHPLRFTIGADGADVEAQAMGALVGNGLVVVLALLLHVIIAEVTLAATTAPPSPGRERGAGARSRTVVGGNFVFEEEGVADDADTAAAPASPQPSSTTGAEKKPTAKDTKAKEAEDAKALHLAEAKHAARERRRVYRRMRVPLLGVAAYATLLTPSLAQGFRLAHHADTTMRQAFGIAGLVVWLLPAAVFAFLFLRAFDAAWRPALDTLGEPSTPMQPVHSPSAATPATTLAARAAAAREREAERERQAQLASVARLSALYRALVVGNGRWVTAASGSNFLRRFGVYFEALYGGPPRHYFMFVELLVAVAVAAVAGMRPYREGCATARAVFAAFVVARTVSAPAVRPFRTTWHNGAFTIIALLEAAAAVLIALNAATGFMGVCLVIALVLCILKSIVEYALAFFFRYGPADASVTERQRAQTREVFAAPTSAQSHTAQKLRDDAAKRPPPVAAAAPAAAPASPAPLPQAQPGLADDGVTRRLSNAFDTSSAGHAAAYSPRTVGGYPAPLLREADGGDSDTRRSSSVMPVIPGLEAGPLSGSRANSVAGDADGNDEWNARRLATVSRTEQTPRYDSVFGALQSLGAPSAREMASDGRFDHGAAAAPFSTTTGTSTPAAPFLTAISDLCILPRCPPVPFPPRRTRRVCIVHQS